MRSKKISIIISNRNDTAMLSITVRSCIEELLPFGKAGEIVICDNSDESISQLLPSLLPSRYEREGKVKVIPQPFPCLFSAREKAAQHAKGEYILCLDSHMLCGRDMISSLVKFMDSRKDDPTLGFAHAPINWAHQHEAASKHDRDMSKCELGDWNNKYNTTRMISWKGMPWICRRSWFLNELGGYGALSKHRISWGGGDMHIGIKPWLLGYKNWAVPCRPGIHIGPYPKIDLVGKDSTKVSRPGELRYRTYSSSGKYPHTFGFLVSCYILGGEPMMERNKGVLQRKFGKYISIDKHWQIAKDIGQEEKDWLDANKVMTFEQLLSNRPWEK